MAGLYAEGRIETRNAAGLTLPATALVREGDNAFAWRVKDRAAAKGRGSSVGERDARSGEFVLKSGLAEGDQLLRYPTSTLQDGQRVEMAVAGRFVSDHVERASLATASGK